MKPHLAEIHVADDPEVWADLGFDVVDARCRLESIDIVLTGSRPESEEPHGIYGWTWRNANDVEVGDISTKFTTDQPAGPAGRHPNSALGVFYVVLFGPSWDEAADAMRGLGLEPGLGEAMGSSERAPLRSLADAGDATIEVIGPPEHDPTRGWDLWGTIIEVADIDATAELLGDRLRPVKPAAQHGRRIATLDNSAGSSVALAFMSRDET